MDGVGVGPLLAGLLGDGLRAADAPAVRAVRTEAAAADARIVERHILIADLIEIDDMAAVGFVFVLVIRAPEDVAAVVVVPFEDVARQVRNCAAARAVRVLRPGGGFVDRPLIAAIAEMDVIFPDGVSP